MDNPSNCRGTATAAPQLIYNRGQGYPIPEWCRVPQAIGLFSIGRSTLYGLIRSGQIASRVVKSSRHNVSGIRLVNTESLRAFIEAQPTVASELEGAK